MNIPALIVACVTGLAFFAHVLGGTRETARIEPMDGTPDKTRYWVQAMCAFQMLSVDLLAVTALLAGVALWDLGPAEGVIVTGLIALFALWGGVWLTQCLWLKRPDAGLLRLPHWIVWFARAGVLALGL
ncbi:hypothetical protein [uncultured Tateyamaria sp.]|uniref:hypothetical protein n=1 Tax=uncultured Tateyamaria sp. TaxID=455651 RepID=UPI002604640C|nr:hypothetical protein [uncultured Tateyamaria sp.]